MCNPHRPRHLRPGVRPLPAVVLGLIAVLELLLARITWAQPVGAEFQVNTYTTSPQRVPAVGPDGAGGFVVVWDSGGSSGTDTGSYSVQGQRYTSAGTTVGAQFQVNTYTPSSQYKPAVCADGAGGFVVVWQSIQDGSSYGVFGKLFQPAPLATLQPLGPEFQVNTYTTEDQKYPAVAAAADGRFVVVWQSDKQDGSSYGVFGQRHDSAGTPQGSEFQVNTYTTSYQSFQYGGLDVAADGAGNFVVVWMSDQGPPCCDVLGQRYDSGGVAQGGEFQVGTALDYVGSPAVAAAAGGSFVVAWIGPDGPDFGIRGQRYDSAGTPQGSEFQVNTYTTGQQGDYYHGPGVAVDGAGNFVVVWSSDAQDGSAYGVFGQRYDSAGAPQGGEFQVNTYTTHEQLRPAVAAAQGGDFVVVWQSFSQDGDGFGVFGQRYDSAGSAQGGEFQVNTYTTGTQGDYYHGPGVAVDGAGNFVVVWSSSIQYSVFGQRYDSAGTAQGGEFQVNTYTTNIPENPDVAAAGAGDFVVAWTSNNADGYSDGVLARRFVIADEVATGSGPVTTDPEADGATAADPVETTVTSPNAGPITIVEGPISGTPPAGFQFLGQQVRITASAATASDPPLVVIFELDASVIPAGETQNSIQVFRDGVAVPACTGTLGDADPDPCVSSRVLQGDADVKMTILTSAASDWNFGVQAATPLPVLGGLGWITLVGLTVGVMRRRMQARTSLGSSRAF